MNENARAIQQELLRGFSCSARPGSESFRYIQALLSIYLADGFYWLRAFAH